MRVKSRNHFLSVVIPAYKQERTIVRDLKRVERVLKEIRYDYEIVCVVDGWVDRTWQRAKRLVSPKIKVVGYESNKGK